MADRNTNQQDNYHKPFVGSYFVLPTIAYNK
jgi:hypothetical protein